MSQAEALTRARALRESLLDHGVRAVSIELVRGRPAGPNGGWWDDRFVGTLGHHIVSHRGQGLTPGLNLVKVGRSDLVGPLCGGYGGFDEIARIICMGWANHPGAGGPYTVPSGVIPANNGRPYLFGWEHEGGIHITDWTPSFREFMGRCHAGTLDWLGLTETSHLEHKHWAPGRKTDRLGYTLGSARAEIAPHLTQEDHMLSIGPGSSKEDIRAVQQLVSVTFGSKVGETGEWDAATRQAVATHLGSATGDSRGKEGAYVNGRMFVALLTGHARKVNRKAIAAAAAGGASVAAVIAEIISRLS